MKKRQRWLMKCNICPFACLSIGTLEYVNCFIIQWPWSRTFMAAYCKKISNDPIEHLWVDCGPQSKAKAFDYINHKHNTKKKFISFKKKKLAAKASESLKQTHSDDTELMFTRNHSQFNTCDTANNLKRHSWGSYILSSLWLTQLLTTCNHRQQQTGYSLEAYELQVQGLYSCRCRNVNLTSFRVMQQDECLMAILSAQHKHTAIFETHTNRYELKH